MASQFVHLRIHTEYSLIDGIVRIKPLIEQVKQRGMSAFAVTDYCNLFAVIKTYKHAVAAGLKPIIGCDLPCCFPDRPDTVYLLTVLCQNETGYRHLTQLVSKAYLEGQYQGKPRIHFSWLLDHADGLILLSGAQKGLIGQTLLAGDEDKARTYAEQYAAIFKDRFYLEIQRTGQRDEAHYNECLLALADALQLPLVATNMVCFLNSEDFEAHTARVCIHEGLTLDSPVVTQHYTPQQYLRSEQEMLELFQDLPQALANTVAISQRATVMLELGHNYLPSFPIPQGLSIETYLSNLAQEGLEERLLLSPQLLQKTGGAGCFSPDPLSPLGERVRVRGDRLPYDQRLALELEVINNMGFAGYFLIVADFIQWAKANGVPVGPGRGSGAGSLVAYALKITDLDPLQYDLLFERFLNPERVSMPDFDIDFCMEGRDRVIAYVAEKYGRTSVSQIITFGTMAAKAVIRDVGRVLGHPYGFVDKIAKLIPFELGMTLTKALTQEAELQRRYHEEEDVNGLIDLALKLEGITRNAGKHAGGVVIAPSQLTDFTAIYCEQGSTQIVSQLDKDDVEAVGLVKFDFLGLRTLTIIDWALKTINTVRRSQGESPVDISLIPMNDAKTFALLKACQTTAIFQLESRGMKEIVARLQPDCFEDIIALVALFRPGPLQSGMVDDFIARKHGLAHVEYPHPDLAPILKPTYGVILYQEQVMQIAQVLANYTLGAADLLRRAMGKKKPEEMAKQRAIFVEGATARGVSQEVATHIFDLMEKFAGYGFNKSHSAAYALIAYQTAWLKAHYPAAFMAAVLSSDMDNTDKVVHFLEDCTAMGLTVQGPVINASFYRFTVADASTLRYGLGAIKGIGEQAVDAIIQERVNAGVYHSLFDFCRRIDLRKVNRRVLEALIKSGALDEFHQTRAVLMASLESALRDAESHQRNMACGQGSLLALLDDSESDQAGVYLPAKPWPLAQQLEGEKETLGFYFSGHPVDTYLKLFGKQVTPIQNLKPAAKKQVGICALVTSMKRVTTKNGKKLLILAVEDGYAKLDVVIFEKLAQIAGELIQTGRILVFFGEISQDAFRGGVRMAVNEILTTSDARSKFSKCLRLTLTPESQPFLDVLMAKLQAHPGDTPVKIEYQNQSARVTLHAGAQWRVNLEDELIIFLQELLGEERCEVLV